MSKPKFQVIGPIGLESSDMWKPVEQHASALGWAIISWCQLYEQFGLLFAQLLSPGEKNAALAAWHEVKSDRTQRHMLRSVVKNSLGQKPLVQKYILWALGELDQMENHRNNAVHAPVDLVWEAAGIYMAPSGDSQNPRALALAGKDLEIEFRRYGANTDALKNFIIALRKLAPEEAPAGPLPEKPQLLSYEQAIARWRGNKPRQP